VVPPACKCAPRVEPKMGRQRLAREIESQVFHGSLPLLAKYVTGRAASTSATSADTSCTRDRCGSSPTGPRLEDAK